LPRTLVVCRNLGGRLPRPPIRVALIENMPPAMGSVGTPFWRVGPTRSCGWMMELKCAGDSAQGAVSGGRRHPISTWISAVPERGNSTASRALGHEDRRLSPSRRAARGQAEKPGSARTGCHGPPAGWCGIETEGGITYARPGFWPESRCCIGLGGGMENRPKPRRCIQLDPDTAKAAVYQELTRIWLKPHFGGR